MKTVTLRVYVDGYPTRQKFNIDQGTHFWYRKNNNYPYEGSDFCYNNIIYRVTETPQDIDCKLQYGD